VWQNCAAAWSWGILPAILASGDSWFCLPRLNDGKTTVSSFSLGRLNDPNGIMETTSGFENPTAHCFLPMQVFKA